jgi:hypothetical protein
MVAAVGICSFLAEEEARAWWDLGRIDAAAIGRMDGAAFAHGEERDCRLLD